MAYPYNQQQPYNPYVQQLYHPGQAPRTSGEQARYPTQPQTGQVGQQGAQAQQPYRSYAHQQAHPSNPMSYPPNQPPAHPFTPPPPQYTTDPTPLPPSAGIPHSTSYPAQMASPPPGPGGQGYDPARHLGGQGGFGGYPPPMGGPALHVQEPTYDHNDQYQTYPTGPPPHPFQHQISSSATQLYDPPTQSSTPGPPPGRYASPGPTGPRTRYDPNPNPAPLHTQPTHPHTGYFAPDGGPHPLTHSHSGGPPVTTQMPEASPGDIFLPDVRGGMGGPRPEMGLHGYSDGSNVNGVGYTGGGYAGGMGAYDTRAGGGIGHGGGGDLASGHAFLHSDPYGPDPDASYDADQRGFPGAGGNDPDLADEPLLQRIHSTPGGEARYGDPFGLSGAMENGNGTGRRMPGGDWLLSDQGHAPTTGAEACAGAAGYGMGGLDDEDRIIAPMNGTAHYGPAPERMVRRLKTTKRVQLFRGNLVLECPVPSALLDLCPLNHRTEQEFSLMRYTAVTSQPDDFEADRYTLRQKQLYEPTRKTEIFIVITMYNEDEVLFARTMRGVMANIAHLNDRDRSPTWKDEGWKKVVVCIVVDGRKIFNPRTRAMIAALGAYQEGVAKNVVNGKPVTAHIYEYTTQLHINSKYQVVPGGTGKKWAPVQIILCVKENNAKKINSHRWFFNAFGPVLKPTVCVLLDVGTDPAPTSIYHLWKTFDLKPTCGGACGEIVALKGKYWQNLVNPLVAAQNFEYKLSNILDKPLESAFGYIMVLPGAFSAYRYKALENDAAGEGPLKQYFLGETMHGTDAGIFTANMYLAEDRILCWELVSKRNSNWLLHYVKSARAVTDVPDRVPELIKQRRRWLNGSFFAAIHSIVHFGYIYRSSHSFGRKLWLHVELLYQTFNTLFAWFSLGNYYVAFIVLTQSLQTYHSWFEYINIPLQYIYLGLLIMTFLLSMGNRPDGAKWAYMIAMIAFALITCYMIFAAVFLAVLGIQKIDEDGALDIKTALDNTVFRNIVLSLVVTYGLYIAASLIALDPWHMITSFIQYLLLAPSYINVLNVYAFSNVHDVSWGTKGSDTVSLDLGMAATGKGGKKDEVILAVPTEEKDINALYADELRVLAEPTVKEVQTISATQKQEDYYKTFRTNVLLAWVISNGALSVGILTTTKAGTSLASTYMGIILYTVAGLAAFRFLGSTIYLTVRLFQRE